MASYAAIAAVGESVIRFLRGQFTGFPGGAPQIEQITTQSLQPSGGPGSSVPDFNTARGTLTLLLYRVDIDMTQRSPVTTSRDPAGGPARVRHGLSLDLRYLVTAWAAQPDVQQLIMGRALTALEAHATFGPPDLVSAIGALGNIWGPDESFQFVPDEMGTEDLYQIWDSLGRPFELSVPYKARVVRLEPDAFQSRSPVLERELVHGVAKREGPGGAR